MTAAFEREGTPYRAYLDRINASLDRYFPLKECAQKRVYEAARYSLLAGGKRIRPVLTLEFCRIFGGDTEDAMPFACALEMLHTYSLIHDDLPCMDNDDLRRGRPTNHKVYGEAMALLAGDALLTAAFETVLANTAGLDAAQVLTGLRILAVSAGAGGMIGGQVMDMQGSQEPATLQRLTEMHLLKTGALINAACVLGAVAAGAGEDDITLAAEYGGHLGLAFQITDDILDATGDSATLGKSAGKDESANKSTYVTALGFSRASELARYYTEEAQRVARSLPDSGFLEELTAFLLDRDH